jgi:wyosine [tRNA(Phe)-imidazoG37] synthetase (radical SAM superfamily)
VLDDLIAPILIVDNTTGMIKCGFMGDQVSHPYKTTGKLQFCIFEALYCWTANWKTNNSAPSQPTWPIIITTCSVLLVQSLLNIK